MTQETSRRAYDAIKPYLPTIEQRVKSFLQKRGKRGATDQEMQDALGMSPQTQTPSRLGLQRKGLLADSGERRKTRANRNAIVWKVLP